MGDISQTRMDDVKELIRLEQYAPAAHSLKQWRGEILSTGIYTDPESHLLFWSISATLSECLLLQGDYLAAFDTAKDTLNIESTDSKSSETEAWSQQDALKMIVRAAEALGSLIVHMDMARAYGIAEDILKPLHGLKSYAYNLEKVCESSTWSHILTVVDDSGQNRIYMPKDSRIRLEVRNVSL